jgi:hypothetical protein
VCSEHFHFPHLQLCSSDTGRTAVRQADRE